MPVILVAILLLQPLLVLQVSAEKVSGNTTVLELHRRLTDEFAKIDPTEAGWKSESLSEEVTAHMKVISRLLVHPENLNTTKLEELLTKDFSSVPLRIPDPVPLGKNVTMRVTGSLAGAEASAKAEHRGAEGFVEALRSLALLLDGADQIRAKFKVMHVELKGDHALTKILFEMRGKAPEGWLQVTSTWHCQWTVEAPQRLHSVRVTDYREVRPGKAGRIEFADAAPAVLAQTPGYTAHLVNSFDYWRARSDRSLISDLLGRQGIAVADVNGDGLEDIYVMQPGGLPNRLFIHQPDGTALDGAAEAGVDILDFGRSCLLIDLDNDGDQDLVLGMAWKILLMENDGDGHFDPRHSYPSDGQINSLGAADYDNDGDLDIYVCGQHPSGAIKAEQGVLGIPMPYYDANNGGPNKLYRNEGAYTFTDVTKEVGMDVNNRRFSLACAWEDFDNDGDQDLYVANDFGRNNLFRNDAGHEPGSRKFTDIAPRAGVEDIGPGMSASWGDFNSDGLADLYVANMWSNAGNRITLQKKFLPGANDALRGKARRHARGNSVYINNGDGTFKDMTRASGANMGRWAWSSNFIDLDNDGFQDLVVANGMLTTSDSGDL